MLDFYSLPPAADFGTLSFDVRRHEDVPMRCRRMMLGGVRMLR